MHIGCINLFEVRHPIRYNEERIYVVKVLYPLH
jgi:hypothetical protein